MLCWSSYTTQHTTETSWASYMTGIEAELHAEGNMTAVTFAGMKG